MYWWMGLCFVVDPERDFLAEPPSMSENEIEPTRRRVERSSHPLTGVSAKVILLFGKLGSLVHAQRVRRVHSCFISMHDIEKEHFALNAFK